MKPFDRKKFEHALVEAYPSHADLAMMVRHGLHLNLNTIASDKEGLRKVIFALCEALEAAGRLDELRRAACEDKPGNPSLKPFADVPSEPEVVEEGPSKRALSAKRHVALRDFSRFLGELEQAVVDMLKRSPAALGALAKELGLGERARSAEEVARVLLHERSGKEAVVALNKVDMALQHDASKAAERRALKSLMLHVLPAATDWRAYAEEGRAKLAAGAPHIDLPLGSKTMAEVVLAGIDCRPCRFVGLEKERGPLGDALTPAPVIAEAFFQDWRQKKGSRFIESLVGLFAIHVLRLDPTDEELRNHDVLCQLVNDKLTHFIESPKHYLPRWLLLDDRVLRLFREHEGAASEVCVHEAVAVIGEALPMLRIVRLGRPAPGELTYALHIGDMFEEG